MRMLRALGLSLAVAALWGCADSHRGADDAELAFDAAVPVVVMTDAGRVPPPIPAAPEAGEAAVANLPAAATADAEAADATATADARSDADVEPPLLFLDDDAGVCVEPPLPCPTDLPATPSRNDVLQAFNGVKGDVQTCAVDPAVSLLAIASVRFGRSGCVESVSVELDPPGAAEVAECVAAAVAQVVVPRFCSDDYAVKFPFRLSSPEITPRPRT